MDNHQLEFAKEVENRMGNIIVVESYEEIINSITNYDEKVKKLSGSISSNNEKFNENLKNEIEKMI